MAKANMLDFRIDPNDVQRTADTSYEGMTSVVGVSNMMNTLASASRHFHLKEEKRNMIDVDRQLNKIDTYYTRQFSKLQNYGDPERLAELNAKYMKEIEDVEKFVTSAGFTKTSRLQAMDKVTAKNDKITGIQDNGLEVKQMQDDINLIVEEQSEVSNLIALEVDNGIKDPDQIDSLVNQYYDNIKQREAMGLISEAEGKAEFTAMYTSAFDQGTLVKALQVIDDNPEYADMSDPEVVRAKKNAQASVLEQYDVDTAMKMLEKTTSGDKYRGHLDMNQVELALRKSHKTGTRSNLNLLGKLQAYQKKVDADASQMAIETANAERDQALKESYAERDLWSNLANGMSFVEAENMYRESMDLPPKYIQDSNWLHDQEYLTSVSGAREEAIVEGRPEIGTKVVPNITPEILADIDNDVTLQYGFLGANKITEIETMWNNVEMPEDERYAAINNLLITSLNGDMSMLPYVIKEASGSIQGLDKGMLYTSAFPSSGNSGQIKTYKETNQAILNRTTRANVRQEEFNLRQQAYTTSGKGKKIDLYNDNRIALAEREAAKGIALTRDTGTRLYSLGRTPSYMTRTYSTTGYGTAPSTSIVTNTYGAARPSSDVPTGGQTTTQQGVFSPQAIGEVLNQFKISGEELMIPMADGTNKQLTAYDLSAMIFNDINSDDPFVIEELNGYILDAYTEMTGKTTGTDMIQGLEADRQWGYVGIGDVSPRVTTEGMKRYVRQRVLQLARPQDTPNPNKTSEQAQQFNFLGTTQY